MKKKMKNSRMVELLHSLEPVLSYRDKIGYIAARNYRFLSNSLIEYNAFKRGLIEKYGEPDKGEDGTSLGTISLDIHSPSFKAFADEMAPFNEMEHEVEIMTAKYEDVVGCLTGEEILAIDWMLED